MKRLFVVLLSVLLLFLCALPCSADWVEEVEEVVEEPVVTSAPEPVQDVSESVVDPVPDVFSLPVPSVPSTVAPVQEDYGISTIAVYEGTGLYHILKQFIGVTFDGTQNYNEYQYLYPASVIVAVVLLVLVAKVLFSLVDRLL